MSMNFQIVSGAPNVTFTAPNKFIYTLPAPLTTGSNDRVSLESLRLYYSWYNVTAAKNNNQLSYVWVDGTTHSITMRDGIWDYADFQGYLEQEMYKKGHYLTNAAGDSVFYITFTPNVISYRMALVIKPVPAVLPTGWTAPSGWVAPASDTTPQVVIPSTQIQSYLGWNAGTYPAAAQATVYEADGPLVPQVTDSSSAMLQTNLTKNEYGPDERTLAIFNVTQNTKRGSLISEVPFYPKWIPVQPGVRLNKITLEIVDQNSKPLVLQDTVGFVCNINLEMLKD